MLNEFLFVCSMEGLQLMILKKSASNPILNRSGIQTSQQMTRPTKHNKQYIQQLEAEVCKSKIAIENMSHANVMDTKIYKKVEELKKELHFNILKINQETDKHKTLTEFIENLKGQMNEFEAVQKNQEEYESNNFEKKIKKVEYDIKQILHKSNEEIAKINNLKEEANAARDQRVVYSNLFNKIEKEIKHYQQIYKQTLIKNQIFLDKKKESQSAKPFEDIDEIFQDTLQNFAKPQQNQPTTRVIKLETVKRLGSKSREARKSSKRYETDMFITNVKDSHSRAFIDTVKTNSQLSSTGYKNNVSLNTNLSNMIEEKERDIERIIMTSECRNIAQVFQYYSHIYQLNDNLFQQVELLNSKISTAQEELDAIKKRKRTSETQFNQLAEEISTTNQPKECHFSHLQTNSQSQLTKIALSICKMLKVDCSSQKTFNEEIIRQIDSKVDDYANCPSTQRRPNRRQSKMVSAQEMSAGTQRGASQILDKIQKFNESQKIFDRDMFRMQYQKEVCKARKKGKRIN